MRRCGRLLIWIAIGVFAAGCPKGKQEVTSGDKALDVQDYDAAVDFYLQALKAQPHNVNYKIKLDQARFEAGQKHIKNGMKLREKGDLQGAVSEFQRAQVLDPSNPAADQEVKRTIDLIAEKSRAAQAQDEEPIMENGQPTLASRPPELKPLSRAPINLKMSNDAKVIFDTIGKLAGLTVIYDPDLQARRIPVELNNVTLEQALDIVSLESKTFWKPVTENIIMVVPDQTQKRRDYEEQVVRTFYLSNVAIAQDLTEITTGLRQLLDLKRITQVNAQNAIVIRDTPDKIALAEKIIRDIDKAKPEVVVQLEVLQARTDRLRDLGILPGQSASIQINPNNCATTSSGCSSSSSSTTTTSSSNTITLHDLAHLNSNDYTVTIPSLTANFVLTDTSTKIIDNPEIRALDGQQARIRVGDRVPVATGSFQAGVGVGSTAGAGFVNPLVNTQFQYIDVGVNVDITPHVHPNREVSLKVDIEVSSVTGTSTIGGISQPIISQRKITQEIRLKEGEVSILGGLFERVDSKTVNGWPGFAQVPIMKYFFSDNSVDRQENENLIVLIPRIVRMPDYSRENMRAIYSGTETFPGVKREMDVKAPTANPNPQAQPVTPTGGMGVAPVVSPGPESQPSISANPTSPMSAQPGGPRLHFEPSTLNLSPGQTATVGIVVDNVTDLYSVPMLLQYNPAVISVEEVRHGGFLSGGTQEIALVQRVDKEHGQAIISATRQPNTPGVNGNGTLLGVVVKGLAPGTTTLSIVQVNAKDSQQRPIPFVTGEAVLKVQ
jgi:general secretion pathway protein D